MPRNIIKIKTLKYNISGLTMSTINQLLEAISFSWLVIPWSLRCRNLIGRSALSYWSWYRQSQQVSDNTTVECSTAAAALITCWQSTTFLHNRLRQSGGATTSELDVERKQRVSFREKLLVFSSLSACFSTATFSGRTTAWWPQRRTASLWTVE